MIQGFLLAFSVSLDAFSVSITQSKQKKFIKSALITSALFGIFQTVMPLIGWLAGSQFKNLITNIDHWIAFFLLLIIGMKMIFEGMKPVNNKTIKNFNYTNVLMLAIATSIDALVIGITFAFIKTDVLTAVILFGAVTFIMSLTGSFLGKQIRKIVGSKMEIVGGIILISIGTKILIEHLFF